MVSPSPFCSRIMFAEDSNTLYHKFEFFFILGKYLKIFWNIHKVIYLFLQFFKFVASFIFSLHIISKAYFSILYAIPIFWLKILIVCIRVSYSFFILSKNIIFIILLFFTPANDDGLSPESEWQQVSWVLQDSSQYSNRSLLFSGWFRCSYSFLITPVLSLGSWRPFLWVIFSKTDFWLCIYHSVVWSNFNFFHNSQWITFPTHSGLVLYTFYISLLIMWLRVSTFFRVIYVFYSVIYYQFLF